MGHHLCCAPRYRGIASAGKFRPLMGKVQANSDAAVRKATAAGFALATASRSQGDDAAALASLADGLCGVGPATASALLAAAAPARFPFMADEALEGCGLPRDYSAKVYAAFAARLQAKAAQLRAAWGETAASAHAGFAETWVPTFNAELCGRALWVRAMLVAHGKEFGSGGGGGDGGKAKAKSGQAAAPAKKAPRSPAAAVAAAAAVADAGASPGKKRRTEKPSSPAAEALASKKPTTRASMGKARA